MVDSFAWIGDEPDKRQECREGGLLAVAVREFSPTKQRFVFHANLYQELSGGKRELRVRSMQFSGDLGSMDNAKEFAAMMLARYLWTRTSA